MARSPLANQSIVCGACGAVIRADRPLCLRCQAPLKAAKPAASPAARVWQTRAMVVGCIALIGIAAPLLRPESQPSFPLLAEHAIRVAATTLAAPVVKQPDKGASTEAVAHSSVDGIRKGEVAYNSGDLQGALAEYQRVLESDANNPVILNNVGQTLVRLNRPSEALPYFDRAIAAEPGTWALHFNRARAYAQLNQWSSAVDGYREAATLFPDDYATMFNLAKAQQANGDTAGSLPSYERAIVLAPAAADFRLSYGRALEAAHRPLDAAKAYREFLELEPASAEAEKVRARIAQLESVKSQS